MTPQRAPVRKLRAGAGPVERTFRNVVAAGAVLFAGYTLWPLFAPQTPRPAAGLVSQAQAAVETSETVRSVVEVIHPPPPVDQHFAGCDDARAAGRENIPLGDPSYRERMDGDHDGLACEPYRGR
ncbi:MAG: excalibur calcium-binding domain-containing protein [Caulobacteraceae bacterium]|nr:excalibur calcium-binding domain-containing protein [Caulobacter sp.]RYF92384.1 MAG: excalibur calcium-binding domain-containing protein [Caulobacteraceae bacterium]